MRRLAERLELSLVKLLFVNEVWALVSVGTTLCRLDLLR